MKYPCIESTVEFIAGDAKIRLWINEDVIQSEYPNKKIEGNFTGYAFIEKPTTKQVIDYFIKEVPRLNAIQIIDKETNQGIVVYTVPFEDVHG